MELIHTSNNGNCAAPSVTNRGVDNL